MADIQKTTYNLNIEFGFVDKDTRALSVPNPLNDSDEVASGVSALNTWMNENQVIIGDKNGASSTGINLAYIEMKTTTNFDLT